MGFSPKPPDGRVPIWVGGSSAAAFRRTARRGDAFHAAFEPLDRVGEEWEAVGRACEEIGRDRDELEFSTRLYLDPDGRMEPEKSFQGRAEQMLEAIAAWQAVGVGHIVLDVVAGGGAPGRLDALRSFMTEVAAKASPAGP